MLYQIELFTELKNNNEVYLRDRTIPLTKNTKVNVDNKYEVKLNSFKVIKVCDTSIFKSRHVASATTWSGSTFSTFDCNFLRKEKLYTKLKYSRSPQYDIVSGGVAAIFSAFIGFLISEKFGIELVDSGDFYIVFMYCVFLSFSLRSLLRINSKFNTTTSILNLPLIINLFTDLARLLLLGLTAKFNLVFTHLGSSIRLFLY